MLIDDSLVARSVLERILGEVAAIEVVASVASAGNALAYLDDGMVDVIVLDIEMPGMNGIVALPELIRKSSGARVLILSSSCEDGGPAALQALSLGAADTLAKPDRGSFAGRFGQVLVERIVGLAGDLDVDIVADHTVPPPPATTVPTIMHRPSSRPRCILIGSSTGGIAALNTFLENLDQSVVSPILLTQHLPIAFIPFFAKQLRSVTSRTVLVAEDGMRLRDRHLYIAPGDAHLTVAQSSDGKGQILLSSAPARSGCRPSVDPMFASAGEVFGDAALGVVLSGMGNDGTEGARLIRLNGGAIVAQSQDSCVVWGMPGSIVKAGLASAVLDPDQASAYVSRAVRRVAP